MGITNKFSKNAQKHIKKKEPKDGPQFMVEQTVGTQDQLIDHEFEAMSSQIQKEQAQPQTK